MGGVNNRSVARGGVTNGSVAKGGVNNRSVAMDTTVIDNALAAATDEESYYEEMTQVQAK